MAEPPLSPVGLRVSDDEFITGSFVFVSKEEEDISHNIIQQSWLDPDGKPLISQKARFYKRLNEQVNSRTTKSISKDCLRVLESAVDTETNKLIRELGIEENAHKVLQTEEPLLDEVPIEELPPSDETEQLLRTLHALEAQGAGIKSSKEALKEEYTALRAEQQVYWADYNGFLAEREHMRKELGAIAAEVVASKRELNYLAKRQAHRDIFDIDVRGDIATINGFRFGKRTAEDPPWEEINAGWGEAALALSTIHTKLGPKATRAMYRVLPVGNLSWVTKVDASGSEIDKFPLHFNGEFSTSSSFLSATGFSFFSGTPRYDLGMTNYLKVMADVANFAGVTRDVYVPWKIVGDKLVNTQNKNEEYTIKYHSSSSLEGWTKALKCVLENLLTLLCVFDRK